MAIAQTDVPTPRKPLRLWPGVAAVVLLWLARFGLKAVVPGFAGFALGMKWALGAALAVVLWWVFFSRARWSDRLGGIALMAVALAGTWFLKHESMGPLWLVGYAVPVLCLALVAGAAISRRLPDGPRRATMAAIILLACGVWTLVRTTGINGDHVAEFGWRWAKSPKERLLAQAGHEPAALSGDAAASPPPETPGEPVVAQARDQPAPVPGDAAASAGEKTAGDWPGFRGPDRDGTITGVRIETDWAASPPVELWRRPIGPGWSSFAVHGNYLYTQEQRGDDEVVACYN